MAYPTISAPYGFKPYNLSGGRVYSGSTRMIPIKEGYATNMFYGDLVQLAAGALNASSMAFNTAAAVAGTIGVFQGAEYSITGGPIYGKNRFQYWPASTVAQDAIGYVVDDNYALFKAVVLAQPGGAASNTTTTIGAVSEAFVGTNVSPVTGTSGNVNTGDSAWGVSSSTAPTNGFGVIRTTTTLPFRIVQLVPDTAINIVGAGTVSTTTITLATANAAIQAGMQVIIPNTTGGFTVNAAPGDFNYVTNVNGTTVTIATSATQASTVNIQFVGYPEVIVAWNFGYHSYQQAAGV
jgi:hypothetical protein